MSPSVAESEQDSRSDGQPSEGFLHLDLLSEIQRIQAKDPLAARVARCVSAAFDAMGISPVSRQLILWNLLVARKLGLEEIVDRPADFIEGMRALWGGAAASVFEHKLMKEIKREFSLEANLRKGTVTFRTVPELLQYATSRIGD